MRTISTLFTLLLIPFFMAAQDGTLDPSFGTGGKSYVTPPGLNQSLSKTVVQPDGKTVLVGRASDGTGYIFSVARFRADGQPDSTFDGDGVVVTQLEPGSRNDNVNTVAVQPDGKIIAGGNSNNNFVLVRYNVNGSLDASFNGTGIVRTPLPGSSVIYSVVVLSNGKILAGGSSNPAATLSDFTLARYNPNGSLDLTFDGDGIVTTDINTSSSDILYSLAIQPDGKIAAAGSSNSDMAVVRYSADGTPDNSFNGNGKLLIDFGNNEIAYSLAIQADGKLVAAGVSNSITTFNTAVARILPGGQPDNSFDLDGKVSTAVGDFDQFYSVVIQQNAKIVASGTTYRSGTSDYLIVRYNPDGSLDPGFDEDGKLSIDMGSAEAFATVAGWGTTLVVGGYSNNQLAVARLLNSSGVLVLPIKLLNFTATATGQTVSLNWKITGTDLLRFEIEQSSDGSNFTTVGRLAAKGSTGIDQPYSFQVTQSASGSHFYRLKIFGKNGSATYSTILAVQTGARKDLMLLSSNPVRNELRLQLTADEKTVLSIIDAKGSILMRRQGFVSGTNAVAFDITALARGVYHIVVTQAGGTQHKSFVKN